MVGPKCKRSAIPMMQTFGLEGFSANSGFLTESLEAEMASDVLEFLYIVIPQFRMVFAKAPFPIQVLG
jgi:hypothetical protein